MSNSTWLVVGLGKPRPGHAANRHNVGQKVLDILADRISASFKSHKANASVAEGRLGFGGPKIILAKPGTFMNNSGGPVAGLMNFYDVAIQNVIVIHDELDIDAGAVRVKQAGGHAGHNGLRDIIAAADSNDFVRVRVGIGRPPGRMDAADFVLKNFSGDERKDLPLLLALSADAVEEIVTKGVLEAMNAVNAK